MLTAITSPQRIAAKIFNNFQELTGRAGLNVNVAAWKPRSIDRTITERIASAD